MGNCAPKSKIVTSEVRSAGSPRSPPAPAPPTVRLYGPSGCPVMSTIRVALLYKTVTFDFCPSGESPVLECCGETMAGSLEVILRYIDAKLPGPAILGIEPQMSAMPGVAVVAALQHRSIERHVGRMVLWAEDLVARGGRAGEGGNGSIGRVGGGDSPRRRGSPRMEFRRFGRSYSQLVELMLEHAQMEERVVFPVLDRADRGLCRAANEEHARDLPIMNGIKEDIKSIAVLDPGGPAYQEALLSLSFRLHTLQEHCSEHFAGEERNLLPLLEAAEWSSGVGDGGGCRMEGELEQLVEVMEATHSHLFNYLIAGLLPHEAMQYLGVVCRCRDRQRVVGMLCSLEARLEAAGTAATTPLGNLLKAAQ